MNTPAFHDEDVRGQVSTAAEVGGGSEYPGTGSPGGERYWRWYPGGWGAPKAKGSPQSEDLLADLEAWISDTSHTKSSTWTDMKRGLVDLLMSSVGSSDVRSVFSEVGATPVLYVVEADGDPAQTVLSLETLNDDHPDPSALDDALAFWRDVT